MNDDDEFIFELDCEPSLHTAQLLSEVVAQNRANQKYPTNIYLPPHVPVSLVLKNKALEAIARPIVNDIVHKCRTTIGIVSFSATKNDHLWEMYGGKGNGAVVEINIPDDLMGKSYHPVRYVPEKIFHVDSFLESALFPDRVFETYRDILLTKTTKWAKEEEIRFIGKQQDVPLTLDGHISEITFGPYVAEYTLERLVTYIADHSGANNIRITKL